MGFDILSYAIGLQAGKASGGGGSSKKTVFAEQTISLASGSCTLPAYYPIGDYSNLIVLWGETEYKVSPVTAQEGMHFAGNASIIEMGEDTGEPFIFVTASAEAMGQDTGMTQITAKDISLTSIKFAVYGVTSSGGGSSNDSYRIVNGSFTPKAEIDPDTEQELPITTMTVEHEIGEVPDIIVLVLAALAEPYKVFYCLGFSQKMIDKLGGGYLSQVSALNATGGLMGGTADKGIENIPANDNSWYSTCGGIRAFTDSTFVIGGTQYGLQNYSYRYTAICGIT